MPIDTALIHRARQVGRQRSASRNAQGEYVTTPVTGPWVPARVMERGGVSAKTRGGSGGDVSSEARVARSYELLIGAEDEDGNVIDAPTGSSVFETDCPVLGSPTVPLDGDPEVLNDGDELIGYLAYGEVPLERS